MINSSQEPLITYPKDAIIDLSSQLDESRSTEGFRLPVYSKPEKKHKKRSLAVICCVISIVSTTIAICATLGLFN